MRRYTEEVIKDKFERLRGRIDKDKQLLKIAGVEVDNDVTLKAFLVGRLDTLIFDMVASLEGRPVSQRERGKS